MKKIGIKTFYDANNYGAVAQTYALKRAIEEMGCVCGVIENEADTIRKRYAIKYRTNNVRSFVVSILSNFYLKKKYRKFEQFRETHLSIMPYDETFDTIVAGSDQIWNTDIIGTDTSYYLDFVKFPTRKVAYAPSFGKNVIDEDEVIEKWLASFDFLSIREREGQNAISRMTGITPPVVLDPTFLRSKQDWIQDFDLEKPLIKNRYILCYVFSMDTDTKRLISRLAKEKNCYVVCIANSIGNANDSFIYKRSAGLEEWLNYFFHAEYIVTNSFHGTALSLIFEKQFCIGTIHNQDTRCRIDNLLETTGIGGRLCDSCDTSLINYETVNRLLSPQIEKSTQWLKIALDIYKGY